jgi:hypothetical protein
MNSFHEGVKTPTLMFVFVWLSPPALRGILLLSGGFWSVLLVLAFWFQVSFHTDSKCLFWRISSVFSYGFQVSFLTDSKCLFLRISSVFSWRISSVFSWRISSVLSHRFQVSFLTDIKCPFSWISSIFSWRIPSKKPPPNLEAYVEKIHRII